MTRPLRILFVTDAFPPHGYGSAWSTYHLARGLRSQGHAVRVIVAEPARRFVETRYDGFRVWRAGSGARRFNPALFALAARGPGRVVRDQIRTWQPDVLHAQHVHSASVAHHAARRVPVVITVRDHWPICFYGTALADSPCPACLVGTASACNARRGSADANAVAHHLKAGAMRLTLHQRRQILQTAAAVIAVSSAIAAELPRDIAENRVHIIPNAVDDGLTNAHIPGDRWHAIPERYFLYAGKLSWHKGADTLIGIADRLGLDATSMIVVGDGPEAETLRAYDPTGRRIRVLGTVPNDEVIALMAGAIALIFPSRWSEPLSRSLLEAMSMGCPIVATDTGGTREAVVDGETGFLTAVDDVAAMAAHLTRLAAEADLRGRMSRAARARSARHFSLAAITMRMVAIYERAMTDTGR